MSRELNNITSDSHTTTAYHYLPDEIKKELIVIAQKLLTPGKGILASDESIEALGYKFKDIDLENTEDNRRLYRKLLFTTEELENYISGIILVSETVFQRVDPEDKLLIDVLLEKKIIPGIRLDSGAVPLNETEHTTQGFDNLGPRCEQFKNLGCHFAKWRSSFKIGPNTPSDVAIQINSNNLAKFASVCQAYRMVPIVEAEVLTDGSHGILHCQKVTEKILVAIFKALNDHDVLLEGMILRPNMVTPGYSHQLKATPEEIGEATVLTLLRSVPISVSGIGFLSGGQSEEDATLNLNAINKGIKLKPWPLIFIFSRALQVSVIFNWEGNPDNTLKAQSEFIRRVKLNSDAILGTFLNEVKEREKRRTLLPESQEVNINEDLL